MIVRLKLFGAEVLYLGIGDGDAEEGADEREVDTGIADGERAPSGRPIGFLPERSTSEEPDDRRRR